MSTIQKGRRPTTPRVSVVMPTYNQARFLCRAIASLQAQRLHDWELIVIDDGSIDDTPAALEPFLADERLYHQRLERNGGLGAALNVGLAMARAPLLAYLPSDDVLYPEHLETLVDCIEAHSAAPFVYSGVKHTYNRTAQGAIEGAPLQLVQVLHRRTEDRWVERAELVTDDLDRMFWEKLRARGNGVGTGLISCEWVDHPDQLHKIIQEPLGGLNTYRARFQVHEPLRFHSTVGNRIDEVAHYRRFRERPDTPRAADSLKILLVGELAYNPERVLALEERGHQLFGLWTPAPHGFNTVGPLPFGHVTHVPNESWQEHVRRIKPDVIYALLNWQTVAFCHHVLEENPGVPFVWHFKEGPFICLQKGLWPQLIELYARADGQVYNSAELRDWFEAASPGMTAGAPVLLLDGDLPKREWLDAPCAAQRISERDGDFHTVIVGRPIGLHPWTVGELAQQRIHLHFYSDFVQGQWRSWIEKAEQVAHGFLHLHPTVDQDRWVTEFSQYDAGWLHLFPAENHGDIRRASWDDLNLPARLGTLVAAGLPLLQTDNSDHIVAMQNLARKHDLGIAFSTMEQLRAELTNADQMARLRASVWRQRDLFTFDYHTDRLIAFLRQVIERAG
jgi:hypothetical protein